jgi:lipopolysaccharide transport system permease protein
MTENIRIFFDFSKKLLFRDRSAISTMVSRDLRSQYVGSFFGILWALLEPLSQLLIFGLFFGVLLKIKPDPIYRSDSFFLYLLCGLVPWQFFSQSVISSTTAVVSNSNLIKKAVGFPSEILAIVKVLTHSISHFIGVILIFVIISFTAGISPYMLLFIIYTLLAMLFAIGLGWIVSSLNVYLKDVRQVIGILVMAWMYATPIFYSTRIVPESLMPFYKLNPMYHVVTGYRYALLADRILPWPDLAYLAAVSLITFAVGGIFFRRLKPGFAEVL